MPVARSIDQRFTYRDYLGWGDDTRYELLDGAAVAMSPAPGIEHQEVLAELLTQIRVGLRGGPCRAFPAPFDVRLPRGDEPDEEVATVVQPDISVICDPLKLDRRGCRGAPDWIIEVLSPSTAARDQIDKRRIYEQHGVRELWLVHPIDRIVTRYLRSADSTFEDGEVFETKGAAAVGIFPDLEISWDQVFSNLAPSEV